MHAVAAHEIDVFFVADAAFGYNGFAVQFRQEVEGLLQGHFKRTQVAVVDAHNGVVDVAAFFQLGRIVQPNKTVMPNSWATASKRSSCSASNAAAIRRIASAPTRAPDKFGIRR